MSLELFNLNEASSHIYLRHAIAGLVIAVITHVRSAVEVSPVVQPESGAQYGVEWPARSCALAGAIF